MRGIHICMSVLMPMLAPGALVASEIGARIVAEATGGRMTSTKGKVFAPDCNQALDYEAEVIDLNRDGAPEVFTMVHGTCLGGGAGVHMNLLIKGTDGRWHPQFGFPGIYTVLATRHLGFPDIEIGGPGFCFPIWRWDGGAYAIHKTCPR